MENINSSFNLNYKECRTIIENIDNLVVVDDKGYLKYIDKKVLKLIEEITHYKSKDIMGKHIREVRPLSKIESVIESKQEDKECFYFEGESVHVSRIKPIFSDGKLSGVMDYDVFSSVSDMKRFTNKMINYINEGHLDIELHEINKSMEKIRNYKYSVGDIIGKSDTIQKLRDEIVDIADSNSAVLIGGETGTGKELVAHSIHSLSRRALSPFVIINCASIPENLVESELFGYIEGSFTGAVKGGKKGKFEIADKGTVFLDEIDALPYSVQPKLLRFLQEKEIDRVGGTKSIPVDVRVIAASNRPLKQLVKSGEFREDLYYRLNVVRINIAPLRNRKEDLAFLAENHVDKMNLFLGRKVKKIDDGVVEVFHKYKWPGNVRELYNVIENAMNKCKDSTLTLKHFDDFLSESFNAQDVVFNAFETVKTLEEITSKAEQEAIINVLNICDGNKKKAAELLNISRPTLYDKMKKLGVE